MSTRVTAITLALAGSLFACSSDAPTEDTPPTLEVTSPTRGAIAGDTAVTVTGTAHGGGGLQVTVDGMPADIAPDGSFAVPLQLEAGIAIIETHASDSAGNDVRDVRAVLAGPTAMTDGTTSAPLGARAGTTALTAIGDAIATAASGIDFTAAATALNPIYNNTGCLGARVDITSVSVGTIGVALKPADAITTDVTIDNVTVKLHASFKVACIGGSTTITVHANRARVHGDLGVRAIAGDVSTSLANTSVAFEGFTIDVGGVPGAIDNLLRDQAQSGAERAITTAIRDRVPPLADKALRRLVARPLGTTVLAHDVAFDIAPARTVINTDGLFVQVDAKLAVDGGAAGIYAANPSPLTLGVMPDTTGMGVVVADDLANQMLGGLWAAGAFDRHFAVDASSPFAIVFDGDVASIDLELSLPPTLTTRGKAELAVGDVIVTGKDAAGTEVQSLALSLRTSIAAAPNGDGKLTLTLGTPDVHVQVLAESAAVDSPLDGPQIEGIVGGVWGLVGGAASDAIGKLPMPSFAGLTLGEPTIDGQNGFLRASIAL